MDDKSRLLARASGEFLDRKIACRIFPAERVLMPNGFVYLLVNKKRGKKVENLTIHQSVRREVRETGLSDVGDIIIQSPVNLIETFKSSADIYLLYYNNIWIGINNLLGYNNEMRQYDYRAEVLSNYNKDFIVYDIDKIDNNLFNNSIPLWLLQGKRLECKIFPAFLSPLNLEEPFLSVEVVNSRPYSLVRLQAKKNTLQQIKRDTIKLWAVNMTTEQQQEVAFRIQNLSLEYKEDVFGINNYISFIHDTREQGGFGIINNIAVSEFDINYNYDTIRYSEPVPLIRELLVSVNDNVITLFNIDELKIEGEENE